jgi:folate-dependent phosphoribosylglycinamide formyltransferase PurN
MGILPRYRGLNVSDWAAFSGDPVGCTVHLIDEGIDTGDIVCTREVDIRGVRTIAELRERVDTEQLELLGRVLRWILGTGRLPEVRRQAREEGVQHHRMHRELASQLQAEFGENACRPTTSATVAEAHASAG